MHICVSTKRAGEVERSPFLVDKKWAISGGWSAESAAFLLFLEQSATSQGPRYFEALTHGPSFRARCRHLLNQKLVSKCVALEHLLWILVFFSIESSMPEEISPHILHKCGPPSLLPCNEYHLSRVERLQCLGFKACSHGDTTALRRPEVWWPLSSIPKAPNSWVVFKDGHMHSDYYGIVGWNMLKHVETVVPPGEQKNIQKYQTSIAGCSSPQM